ncbi:unnamed protein product [Polarella glacialis]|uniref:Uncharacterized protein n=1 Tax=Polarella glacialis TaxID=89957 RepID=A0A813LBD7_POLGL|nr:unnamed protein product [Polarella glacialis]
MGYCKSIFENAPENRISQMKVIEDCGSLTQDSVSRLVCEQKEGWDLIVFAAGIDPPDSNSVPDVIDQNAFVSRLYFWLLQGPDGSTPVGTCCCCCSCSCGSCGSCCSISIDMDVCLFCY